jgi:hypothetical protein
MKEITVKEGQNLMDIALQYYGSVEATRQVIFDNPEIAEDNFYLRSGQILRIDVNKIVNREIVGYYESLGYEVNTGGDLIPFADFSDDFNNDFDI